MRSVIRIAVVIAAGFALYWLVVLPYRGNLALRAIAQSSVVAQTANREVAVIVARQNLDALQTIAAGRRLAPTWYMLYGANCEVLDRLGDAAESYTAALRIDDRPELYVNRAMVRLHLGQPDAAIADLAYAARFQPTVLEHLDGEIRARVAAAAGMAKP